MTTIGVARPCSIATTPTGRLFRKTTWSLNGLSLVLVAQDGRQSRNPGQ
jgi:hypothetical protein